MLAGIGVIFSSVAVIGSLCRDSLKNQTFLAWFAFVHFGAGVVGMLLLKRKIRRSGIDLGEFQTYIWTRPLMIVVQIGMLVSVIIKAVGLFWAK